MVETLIDKCPRIETERLILRKWEERDLDGIVEMNADPRVMEFFPDVMSHDESAHMLARLMAKQDELGFACPVVEDRVSGRFLGFCGLNIPTYPIPLPFDPCVEIGWRLIPDAWGKGIAQESARIWLEFGFETLEIDEIVSFTTETNLRSQKLMQRLGMTRNSADDFNHQMLEDDHPLVRHVLYRLTKDRFESVSKS
ncbi:Protein N-acetyltransferase, RimJ/RimL family [Pseudovibrio ascidiaceicola]|uniref:Protein N-acetyltransferase, RimJ/RimL family n=1 Tax=Pseudovibrio ascidiaceicola TaxID=285279 RepID=A0A1I3VBW3_9HYPH|nr:GNAT family N-acetyltransferase [Pseudovibrio ascidiaceicola]SFJ92630.1 Protein N-acetyltransferase, RimJ/RimL family [Pseudovibrio ascidiaceicola]